MAKLNFQEKRERIKQIEAQILSLEEELHELLDPQKQEDKRIQNKYPSGFSVNNSILEAVQETPDKATKDQIISKVKEKYGVELSSTQVQSAISYLKSQKKVEIIGRAIYKFLQS